jgi:hypothetical protein
MAILPFDVLFTEYNGNFRFSTVFPLFKESPASERFPPESRVRKKKGAAGATGGAMGFPFAAFSARRLPCS